MKTIFKEHKNSFLFLNATQFLGALNDNIFKLLVIYLLINLKGEDSAGTILAIAGAVFVFPFLLLSSTAGILADKISKTKIIRAMKIVELAIMLFAVTAFYLKNPFFIYFILFLMAAQSAVFGPSKYGIIPDLVESENISKANGTLTSLSYLAIILGTFLASFITDITDKKFVSAAFICVFIAMLGLAASLKIKKTKPLGSTKKITPFFITEIYNTLKLSSQRKYLLSSIFGAAFFLFVGSFIQLNIIPFAMEQLNMTEVGGGYLFLATALGITCGALIAGKTSKKDIALNNSCMAGFFISFLLIILGCFTKSTAWTIVILALLGIFGGIFLIPFESFIQLKSPKKRRGQIIATANFLSFAGILLSSFFIYFLEEILNLSAARSFVVFGFFTLFFSIINTGRLSDIFLPFLAQKILSRFYRIHLNVTLPTAPVIFLNKAPIIPALTLFSQAEEMKIIFWKKNSFWKCLNFLTTNIHFTTKKNHLFETKILVLTTKKIGKEIFFEKTN